MNRFEFPSSHTCSTYWQPLIFCMFFFSKRRQNSACLSYQKNSLNHNEEEKQHPCRTKEKEVCFGNKLTNI